MENVNLSKDIREKDLSNTAYYTCYKCDCESLNLHETVQDDACFMRVFCKVQDLAKYDIKICIDPAILLKNKSNYCMLMPFEVINWVSYIMSLCNGTFELKIGTIQAKQKFSDEYTDYPCYDLMINLKGPNSVHKFALTALRYLYEYPMNVMLKDVFRLKNMEQFENESLLNLFNLVQQSCFGYRGMKWTTHSFSGYSKFVTDEYITKSMLEHDRMNDVFPKTGCFDKIKYFKEQYSFEYWESEESFNLLRLPTYIENYKTLDEERNKNKN